MLKTLRVEGACCIYSSIIDDAAPFLPPRFLDLEELVNPDQVRLRINKTRELGKYATLSYRWGGKMPLRTTRENIKQHMQGLDLHDLPPLFQDAVRVTRALHIRYLWIDALCIIQDDRQDWETQALQMGSIYQRSFVTIAPHSAPHPLEGFLWRASVPTALGISPSHGKDAEETTLQLAIPPLFDHAILRGFTDGHLMRRAWITQELCISKSIAHIVEDRVVWECPHRPEPSALIGSTLAQIFRDRSVLPSDGWLPLVERYAACQMTQATDKLPAVAGLAKEWPRALTYFDQNAKISSTVHGAYYSGIFTDDIHNSLLWLGRHGNLRNQANRAPTWSWASVDGAVTFVLKRNPAKAELMPDAVLLGFECGCRRVTTRHFICAKCVVRLHSAFVQGIEPGLPAKSSRFTFTAERGPRQLTTLTKASRSVGWAVFDDDYVEHRQLHYARISTVYIEGSMQGHCVLALKPSGETDGTRVRVGMGYIFATDLFVDQPRQTIIIA